MPDGMSALSAVPAWQAHGYSMAPYHGNGKSGGAAHPGSAVTVQKLLLEGKKAEALRYCPLCRRSWASHIFSWSPPCMPPPHMCSSVFNHAMDTTSYSLESFSSVNNLCYG